MLCIYYQFDTNHSYIYIFIKLNYYNCIWRVEGGGRVGIWVGDTLGHMVYIFWALNILPYHYKVERQ